MKADFYSTKIQFNVLSEKDEFEKAYDQLPDTSLFICMVDLVKSTNYRLGRGPKLGYVRGETFFSIIRNVINPCTAVRTIKEIGDAVLIVSSDFRPLLETMTLINQVTHQIANSEGDESFPFAIRAAMNFGIVKRLKRFQEDYLGTPIDHLSRIINADDERTNLFISENVYEHTEAIINEYHAFLDISAPIMLPHSISKGSYKEIYYREIYIDHHEFNKFNTFYMPWSTSTKS